MPPPHNCKKCDVFLLDLLDHSLPADYPQKELLREKARRRIVPLLAHSLKKLIADYVFEYNDEGQINQMTTTEDGIDNFTVWKYDFENNLKVKESIFDKNGILIGKIIYEYK